MEIVIEGVNQKSFGYGVIDGDGTWYNAKGQCPFAKGDTVEFEFAVNAKGYKDITTIRKIAGPAPVSGQMSGPLQKSLPEVNATTPSQGTHRYATAPINGMELGLALKQAQQIQTAKIMSDKGYNFNWLEYAKDAEAFFVSNKDIKKTIIEKQI